VHSNGFSLVRRLLLEQKGYRLTDRVDELGGVLGEVLLMPTKIYVKPLLSLLGKLPVKGMAHITGGGFIENIPRILPGGVSVRIARGSWPVLPIFRLIQREGHISDRDMFRTFNMGIGMVIVVAAEHADEAVAELARLGEQAYRIGEVVAGDGGVALEGMDAR
jgi:phosphoribosylformylglycinamidine cyclo-ligase